MIEFGKTLRLAREAKGYTISQLADITRIMHQTIEDLENENFTKIAAPIYGRGFVKLYCEAVGLDPKPMIAEFMEIFNGNRELGIKERAVSAKEEKLPEPIAALPPQQNALFAAPQTIAPEMPSAPAPAPSPAPQDATYPEEQKPTGESRLSRYASPLRDASLPSIPPSVWRMAILGAIGLLALWFVAMGIKALYKATSDQEPKEPAPAEEKPQAAAVDRDKVEVPALYVD